LWYHNLLLATPRYLASKPTLIVYMKKEFVLAVKIRLARHGATKRPYYRVIVADARARRDGRFIEEVGRYNPCVNPAMISLDFEKIESWIANGAQPTDTVARLIKTAKEQV
jgi:small subunit ribosomal protein S16